MGADQIDRGKFDLVVLYSGVRWKVWGFCFAWCCVEWPVLTQRESLVSQARVGLGGVAGGGLTQGADSYTSLSVAPVPSD